MISIYNKETESSLNLRKAEFFDKYNKIIQWGRSNPVHFIERIFNIEMLDYQKYVFLNTWVSEHAVWVMSRNAGKSFLGALYMMTRAVLFPNCKIFIMGHTGYQAKDTFTKIEDITKKKIPSIHDPNDIFFNEIVKNNANTDGFTHDSSQYALELYNGSTITSLVGKAENIVGKRSNLNFYDEAGKIDQHFFGLTEPFTTQSTDFKTGKGYNDKVFPKNIPTQIIYASSAEGVDSHLWTQYVECAKNMMMGIPGYFCADVNCEMPLHPYLNGLATPPLLKQSEVDNALRTNEYKALREYYNIFDTNGGTDAAVPRSAIIRNEEVYLPSDRSQGSDKRYVLLYDPALQMDNSFVLVGEIFKDPEKGYMGRIVNGINLVERISPTDKKPLRIPEQKEWITKLLLLYNGGNNEYDNLDMCIDAGAGGNGRAMGDLLMPKWLDDNGNLHNGIYDENEETEAYVTMFTKKFPTAKPILHFYEPVKLKSAMYGALSDMMQQDLIKMPISLPRNGEMEMEDGTVKILTQEETRALLEIDLMKEEVMSIQKTKSNAGNIIYKLPPNKERKMHDDRAYCMAMFGYFLSELRRSEMSKLDKPTDTFGDYLAKLNENRNNVEKKISPFAKSVNPFAARR